MIAPVIGPLDGGSGFPGLIDAPWQPLPRTVSPPGAGAGNGIRTRDTKLGKLVLYQLSYARLTSIFNKFMGKSQVFLTRAGWAPLDAAALRKNLGAAPPPLHRTRRKPETENRKPP